MANDFNDYTLMEHFHRCTFRQSVPKLILSIKTSPKRLPARFFRLDSGREPVREWLKGLDLADRRIIGEDLKDVEFAWPIGMPLVRALGRDLWCAAAYHEAASRG
jgi:hypothetical protein